MEFMADIKSAIREWCGRRFGTYTTEGANEAAIEAFERGMLDRKQDNPYHPEPCYTDYLKQYRDDWMRGYNEGWHYETDGPDF